MLQLPTGCRRDASSDTGTEAHVPVGRNVANTGYPQIPLSTFHMLGISDTKSSPPQEDARSRNRARFELELEFVQSLANPYYLHSLSQQGILSQPAFVHFLEYLLYWKENDYARFIQLV